MLIFVSRWSENDVMTLGDPWTTQTANHAFLNMHPIGLRYKKKVCEQIWFKKGKQMIILVNPICGGVENVC